MVKRHKFPRRTREGIRGISTEKEYGQSRKKSLKGRKPGPPDKVLYSRIREGNVKKSLSKHGGEHKHKKGKVGKGVRIGHKTFPNPSESTIGIR